MKCVDCRKKEAEITTRWERIKNWLLYTLFSEEVIDLKANSFTQGVGDGYKIGWLHLQNLIDGKKYEDFNSKDSK